MSEKQTGGPAFPLLYDPYVDHPAHGRVHRTAVGEEIQEGMTLRDYFAAKAMQGMIVAGHDSEMRGHPDWEDEFARIAYRTADAMLKAREGL